MQRISHKGLEGAGRKNQKRCIIELLHNAKKKDEDRLRDYWENLSPEEARKSLAMRDVAVTNQKDKAVQLPLIEKLHMEVRSFHDEELGRKTKTKIPVERLPFKRADSHTTSTMSSVVTPLDAPMPSDVQRL